MYLTSRLSAGKWSPPRRLTYGGVQMKAGSAFSSWSPDGKWIVAQSSRGLVVVAADSGASRVLYVAPDSAPPPETAVWSRDGRSIYFKSHDAAGRAMISVMPASGGTPRPIVRFPDLTRPSSRQGFAASATRFYFPIEDRQSNVWIAELSR